MQARLEISNKDHFRKALAFSRTLGKESRKSFRWSLTTLNRLKRNYPSDCILDIGPDFVEHSFRWVIYKKILTDNGEMRIQRGYNGGLILHGFEETYSVELNPKDFPHWSIHT